MYIDTLAYQGKVFLYSCGFGFLLGTAYDILKIIRMIFSMKRKSFPVFDIIYTVVSSVLCVIFSLAVCNGSFGFALYSGIPLGFLIYYFALGNTVMRLSRKITKPLKKIVVKSSKAILSFAGQIFKKRENKSENLLQVD